MASNYIDIDDEQEYLARRARRKERMLREKRRRRRRRLIAMLVACAVIVCLLVAALIGVIGKKVKAHKEKEQEQSQTFVEQTIEPEVQETVVEEPEYIKGESKEYSFVETAETKGNQYPCNSH